LVSNPPDYYGYILIGVKFPIRCTVSHTRGEDSPTNCANRQRERGCFNAERVHTGSASQFPHRCFCLRSAGNKYIYIYYINWAFISILFIGRVATQIWSGAAARVAESRSSKFATSNLFFFSACKSTHFRFVAPEKDENKLIINQSKHFFC